MVTDNGTIEAGEQRNTALIFPIIFCVKGGVEVGHTIQYINVQGQISSHLSERLSRGKKRQVGNQGDEGGMM